MWELVHNLALALALAALAGLALRLASLALPGGLARLLAAIALGAGLAAAESLALGVVGLGSSPAVLPAIAVVLWLAGRHWLAEPAVPSRHELLEWWAGLGSPERTLLGAAGGLIAAWAAFSVRYPELGSDAVAFRIPQVAAWVQSGRPESLPHLFDLIPVQWYPQTHELLLTWLIGISRSLVALTLLSALMWALLAASLWALLRRLAAPVGLTALGVLAVASLPLVATQLGGPYTDIAAVAWLACTAALCAEAAQRPGALAPAIVAAGLSAGTKTTTLPALALLLGWGLWRARRESGALPHLALAAAAGLALIGGGIWYLRDLVVHGSPFWPLASAPWGDPAPPFLHSFQARFITHPAATLHGRLGGYRLALGGGVVLLAGGILGPALLTTARRGRESTRSLVAAGGALALLLIWSAAPYTGQSSAPLLGAIPVNTTRYVVPAIGCAAVALVLAGHARSARARLGLAFVLLAAIGWNVEELTRWGFPYVPSVKTLAAGVVGGAVAALLATPLLVGARLPGAWPAAALAVAMSALSLPAKGWVARHGRLGGEVQVVASWLATRPGYATDHRTISHYPVILGPLTGDRLTHPVVLLDAGTGCADVRARARRGWVVLAYEPIVGLTDRVRRLESCLRPLGPPVFTTQTIHVYGSPA